MPSIERVAVAGASGNVGTSLVEALRATGFEVSAITRNSSSAVFPDHIKVLRVDYESIDSITKALQDQDAVVSCFAPAGLHLEDNLIEAAIAAGVNRFIPSQYSADMRNPRAKLLPILQTPVAVQEKLIRRAKENNGMSFTFVFTGAFLEMALTTDYAFVLNIKSGTGTIYDGGDRVVNFTRIETVAKAIAACLAHSDETKNRSVYISETTLTQNQIMAIVNKIDPSKDWTLGEANTVEVAKQVSENVKAGKTDFQSIVGSIFCLYFGGQDYGMPFPKLDNELLGILELSEAEVEAVIVEVMGKES